MSSTIKIPAMPEPFWHAVVSRTAPIIDKAIRRADVAQEYADKSEENYGHVVDIEVKQLFTADQLAARDAQWQESVGQLVKSVAMHLQDAISACNSVSTCLDRKVIRDGCVMYLQTEEWCKWLEDELQPQFRAALSAITEE